MIFISAVKRLSDAKCNSIHCSKFIDHCIYLALLGGKKSRKHQLRVRCAFITGEWKMYNGLGSANVRASLQIAR